MEEKGCQGLREEDGLSSNIGAALARTTPAPWEPGHVCPWAREQPSYTSVTGKLGTAHCRVPRARGGWHARQGSAPSKELLTPIPTKPWVKAMNAVWSTAKGQQWGAQKCRSECAKATQSIPFPAHEQPPHPCRHQWALHWVSPVVPKKGATARLLPSTPLPAEAKHPIRSREKHKAF